MLKLKPAHKKLIFIVILLGIIFACILFFKPKPPGSKITANQMTETAIANLLNSTGLRYKTESKLIVNERTNVYGKVEGEMSEKTKFHAWGMILGSNLDVYQIDDTTYRKDSLSEEWLVTPNSTMLENSMFINELNPLCNFQFSKINEVEKTTDQLADGKKYHKLKFQPETTNPYLSKFFKDLTCTLWLDWEDQQICQANLTATATANNVDSILSVDISFWDWNKPITIQPPVAK